MKKMEKSLEGATYTPRVGGFSKERTRQLLQILFSFNIRVSKGSKIQHFQCKVSKLFRNNRGYFARNHEKTEIVFNQSCSVLHLIQ